MSTVTLVVMGVSGSGKTTVARSVATRLSWVFGDGDDFHPVGNVEKMRAGTPLDDADRQPWLETLASWIGAREQAGDDAVLACSALKRAYRDLLTRGHPSVRFVHVAVSPDTLGRRLAKRQGHYLPPSLLASQLAALEPLQLDEPGRIVDGEGDPQQVVDDVLAELPG